MNFGGLLNAAKALVRFPALYDDCLGQIRSSITGGSYSVNVEIPFNEKHGVAIRVLPNEKITMKVNDDLSSLTGYRTSILGHVVE